MTIHALSGGGDTAGTEKLAIELDKTLPLDTLVQRYWLPTIRAAVALQRKHPNRAIELLKVASTVDLGEITQFNDIPVPSLFAWGSLSHAPRRQPSGSGISEVHCPSRSGDELSMGCAGPTRTGTRLRRAGRHGQSPRRLSGFPHALDRRRP